MKRILLPAGGAILATGLLAAGLAGSAQAEPTADAAMLAADAKAAEIIDFWTKSDNAALKQATAYYWDNKDVKKIVEKGGYVGNTKPGIVDPIGAEKKVTVKSHNVNLPKSIGKVFFEGRDGKLYWCSGTSIQSQYRNLVATAGHCVYDIKGNDEVVSKWVFVPSYYQGKAPYGIYVGKQAWTHYDLSTWEDFDRDYAFVTVYNGVGGVFNEGTKVSRPDYLKAKSEGKAVTIKATEIKEATDAATEAKAKELAAKYNANGQLVDDNAEKDAGPVVRVSTANADDKVGHDYPGAVRTDVEVGSGTYSAAELGRKNGDVWYGRDAIKSVIKVQPEQGRPDRVTAYGLKFEPVTETEYNAFVAKKAAGQEPYAEAYKGGDVIPVAYEEDGRPKTGKLKLAPGGYYIARFYVNQYYKKSSTVKYYLREYFTVGHKVKDSGRLGDNVGGQGVAWNQGTGKVVRTFGYPYAAHPDGSKPYTGVTPKWCYGKTGPKATKVASLKIEEHVSLKCAVTGGYNGAPWLLKYSNAKRMGYVNGVTSVLYDTDGNDRWDYMSSPYFDEETAAVYSAAAKVWSGPITWGLPK
ncbi:trypsin-like serine peptidase [Nonomuraea typhae]|uniref:trypsin-like serine peptidase n=1 Tax=Nonomuraea typhae TaxID=2603600 RepID=UPI0012F7A732|nr:hypothetical protein [Nonomuraea typhae]